MKKTQTGPDVNLMFSAFSDRTRLRILHLIRKEELCVGDLVKVLQLPQPTVSRHLSYLRRAGLVVSRKAGLWMYYLLARPSTEFHERLYACLDACFTDVPELKADGARASKLRKGGGCCPPDHGKKV
ncbi:MAG TPA: metalloregulator ArsR/SmtB family transcription factor [Thermoanaerobaculia bacterium]|nr:metalloregulator ArsR/SmtB family transcription factor [Thermoanaerobaculia bacterium]